MVRKLERLENAKIVAERIGAETSPGFHVTKAAGVSVIIYLSIKSITFSFDCKRQANLKFAVAMVNNELQRLLTA